MISFNGGSDEYWEYLRTEKWAVIRGRVLMRDRHRCQGCGNAVATEVHHLTYRHIFREFLFELVAVCADCHRRLHGPCPVPAKLSPNTADRLLAGLERLRQNQEFENIREAKLRELGDEDAA